MYRNSKLLAIPDKRDAGIFLYLIGYSTEFLSMTRGYGIMNHTFDQYLPLIPGEIGGRHRGALVSIRIDKCNSPRPDTVHLSGEVGR